MQTDERGYLPAEPKHYPINECTIVVKPDDNDSRQTIVVNLECGCGNPECYWVISDDNPLHQGPNGQSWYITKQQTVIEFTERPAGITVYGKPENTVVRPAIDDRPIPDNPMLPLNIIE